MLSQNEIIEHACQIERIEGNYAYVRLVSQPACGNCHAKGACGLADNSTQIIKVSHNDLSFQSGETVVLITERAMGFKAVLLAYVAPFLLFVTILALTIQATANELISGLLAIGSLLPYFIFLYFQKEQLDKNFSFTIKKTTDPQR